MRILVTGATGQLGTELMRALAERAELIGLDLPELDVTRDDCVEQIAGRAPSVVVHAGALTNVDGCERDP
ncbi:MAG TPA: sugar nucleotide-binding protein, partial [Candidatus Sulfotelmatobacter sp.]|nr:sugar nucleotide-binding protein [Candidatus Sulfotelmatobacter sp.]